MNPPHYIDGKEKLIHVHEGYYHDEKGTRNPTPKEQ